ALALDENDGRSGGDFHECVSGIRGKVHRSLPSWIGWWAAHESGGRGRRGCSRNRWLDASSAPMECEAVRAEQAPGVAITSWASHGWSLPRRRGHEPRAPETKKPRSGGAASRQSKTCHRARAAVRRQCRRMLTSFIMALLMSPDAPKVKVYFVSSTFVPP